MTRLTSAQETDPIDDETDRDEDDNNNNESCKGPSNVNVFSVLETVMEWSNNNQSGFLLIYIYLIIYIVENIMLIKNNECFRKNGSVTDRNTESSPYDDIQNFDTTF
ncbi:hypothetical protein TNCV_3461191 [Trichonephila clavipes]|nr:hypothetical protein TNCV_3461191 [Trichonephila clavipes]